MAINLGTQYLFFAPRIRGSRCLHSAAWFARVAAAVFAVPELREVILEQKADLSAQRHGSGQVGQDALQIRSVFLIAHIMSNEKIALRLALFHYSFSQVSKITFAVLIPPGRTTTVPANLSCHPCFFLSMPTHIKPKPNGSTAGIYAK